MSPLVRDLVHCGLAWLGQPISAHLAPWRALGANGESRSRPATQRALLPRHEATPTHHTRPISVAQWLQSVAERPEKHAPSRVNTARLTHVRRVTPQSLRAQWTHVPARPYYHQAPHVRGALAPRRAQIVTPSVCTPLPACPAAPNPDSRKAPDRCQHVQTLRAQTVEEVPIWTRRGRDSSPFDGLGTSALQSSVNNLLGLTLIFSVLVILISSEAIFYPKYPYFLFLSD